MEVRELKFLLKLAALPDYQGKISELKPTSRTKISDTEKICRRLYDLALVDCQQQVTKFKLSSVGKALLKLNLSDLPLTTAEITILQACSQDIITPQAVKVTPTEIRNKAIDNLIARGLITAVATKIKQVWLTDKGKKYLLTEYKPQGNYPVLSLDLLHNYLCFFRQNISFLPSVKDASVKVSSDVKVYSLDSGFAHQENRLVPTNRDVVATEHRSKTAMSDNSVNFGDYLVHNDHNYREFSNGVISDNNGRKSLKIAIKSRQKVKGTGNAHQERKQGIVTSLEEDLKGESLVNEPNKPISDDRVLQTILDLDQQLNTNNYLPIFYLREKLRAFLSREELDLVLYRLQRQDKLELSSIVESSRYTREQLRAGIPQNIGGCLFFLIVVEENSRLL